MEDSGGIADTGSSDLEESLQRQAKDLEHQVQQLRKQVATTSHRIWQDLSKTSTVPVDSFNACDPLLDAALAHSAVQIFLRHMTAIRPDIQGGSLDDIEAIPQRETISQEEIDECLRTIAASERIEAPDPLAGLDDERLWILADLSCFGTGLTRHRATTELRDFLTQVWNDEVHVEMLKDLVQALHKSDAVQGASTLLQVLRLAASNSLERQGHSSVGEPCP